MKNKDKKLEIDLDFLDKNPEKPKQSIRQNATKVAKSPGSTKSNWKPLLILAGIIIVIFWIGSSDDNSNTSSTYASPNTNQVNNVAVDDESVDYGEYRCTQYHYDQAVALSPTESEQTLANAQRSMETRVIEIERLQREIENSYVNEYSSQWEIDDYNDTVDTYNLKLASYERDVNTLDTRIDKFNTQVEAHNKYLEKNCSLR